LVVVLICCAFFLTAASSIAQTLPALASPDQLGGYPYDMYHGGDIDRINLNFGTIALDLPFLSYPQRGALKLSFNLMYNNQPQHIGCLLVPPDPCQATWAWPTNLNALPRENGNVFVGFTQAVGVTASVATRTTQIGTTTYTYYYANWSVLMADGATQPPTPATLGRVRIQIMPAI
jgi:hypothetical protein